jgi:hypothetical protein
VPSLNCCVSWNARARSSARRRRSCPVSTPGPRRSSVRRRSMPVHVHAHHTMTLAKWTMPSELPRWPPRRWPRRPGSRALVPLLLAAIVASWPHEQGNFLSAPHIDSLLSCKRRVEQSRMTFGPLRRRHGSLHRRGPTSGRLRSHLSHRPPLEAPTVASSATR